jgi:hypothetical protein
MRRTGGIVIIYAFMLSYFGVGSVRNAFALPAMPDILRFLAASSGLSWIAYVAGGALMLGGRAGGMRVVRTAAAVSALVFTAGTVLTAGTGAEALVFAASRPLYDMFLFIMLPLLAREEASRRPLPRTTLPVLIASGAALPWAAYGIARVIAAGPLVLPRSPGILISAFMSLWSALPFFALFLTARSWPAAERRAAVLAGGGIGSGTACLYAYSLIWSQGFNVFLLALLPPVVYAGQTAGIIAASLLSGRRGR